MAVDIDLLNSNSLTNIDTNFQRVKNALKEVVGREGDLPNHMNTDLDMNGSDILNAGSASFDKIILDGVELNNNSGYGWSPVFAAVARGPDIVFRLVDYVGGKSKKPTEFIGWYMGAAGFVQDINAATVFNESTGIPDGNKGDIVTSSSGTVWTLSDSVLIKANKTINVPADFPTIRQAWDSLSGTTITQQATVTIKVADGTHEPPGPLHHPNGSQIRIIGNTTDKSLCIIKPSGLPTDSAISVRGGFVLGYIDGFTIDLDAKAQLSHNHTGILATQGGNIICGPNIRVNNWYYGIAARDGATVFCRYAHVSNSGDVGIWAFVGGVVDAQFARSEGASDSANGFGFGFQAEYGGSLDCSNATATTCLIGGVAALTGGRVRALGMDSSNNIGSGVLVREGGHVQFSGSTANNNGRWGWEEIGSGTIYASSSTRSGNVLGPRMPIMFANNYSGSPSIASSLGPARLESLSDGVFLKARGFDALRVYALTGNEVNYAQIDSSLSGSPVEVKARGADTNIDLSLSPKGSGRIRVGPTQAIPAGFTNDSIIEFKASDGAVIQIECKRL